MIRAASLAALLALTGLAACSPQKTPEQVRAEQAATALQQMGVAIGADGAGQVTPEQMAAAVARAGAIASTVDANMTPEERAKLQAMTSAMASGQVEPAVAAYLAGANKVFDLLGNAKSVADVNAVAPAVTAEFAEMTAPAATLKAMPEDKRDIAFVSAGPQWMAMSTNSMKLLSRTSYDSDTMQAIGKLLDQMPQPD